MFLNRHVAIRLSSAAAARLVEHTNAGRWDRVSMLLSASESSEQPAHHLTYAYSPESERLLLESITTLLNADRAWDACALCANLAVRNPPTLMTVLDATLRSDGVSRDDCSVMLENLITSISEVTGQYPIEPLWSALVESASADRALTVGSSLVSCIRRRRDADEVIRRLSMLAAKPGDAAKLANALLFTMRLRSAMFRMA